MKYKIIIILSAFLISNYCEAQEHWSTLMEKHSNFYELEKAYSTFTSNLTISEKSKGIKAFGRMKYIVEPRVFPSGNMHLLSFSAENFNKYLETKSKHKQISVPTWTAMGAFGSITNSLLPNYGNAGRLDFIQVDPNNQNVYYTGSGTSGTWKSNNAGSTWNTTTDNLMNLGAADLVVDPSNSNIVYLATGDRNSINCNSFGVLKSSDGGQTWNTTGLSFPVSAGYRIKKLVINPQNPSELYVAAYGPNLTTSGIYKTTNGGATWTQILFSTYIFDLDLKPSHPNVVYASGLYAFFRSINSGANFSVITNGIPSSGLNGMVAGVTPDDTNYVYVLALNNTGDYQGFYKSDNGGTSFTVSTNTLNIVAYNPNQPGGQGAYNLCLDVSPLNKNEVTIGGINCWRSLNSGTTWTTLINATTTPTIMHVDQHDLKYKNNGDLLIVNDGGIHVFSGSTLTVLNASMNISWVYRIGLSGQNNNLWITGHQDNGTNNWNGTIYKNFFGADGLDCFYDRTNNNNVFGSSQYGGLARSTNSGATWLNCGFGFGITGTPPWLAPWHQDPSVSNRIYSGFTDLFVSNNLAVSWSSLTPISNTTTIEEFAIAPSNNQYIYVVKKNGGVFKTTDMASNWIDVTSNLPINLALTNNLCIDPGNPDHVYVCMSGYSAGTKVFETTNGGLNWNNISFDLPNIPANTIIYHTLSNNRVYVGMDAGVYYKEGNSISWTLMNTGLPNVIVSDLELSSGFPTLLYAATYGRGIYAIDPPSIFIAGTAQLQNSETPFKVYPNPTSCIVNFDVDFDGELEITDVSGRKIKSASIEKGKQLQLNGLAPGIYIYHMYNKEISYNGYISVVSEF